MTLPAPGSAAGLPSGRLFLRRRRTLDHDAGLPPPIVRLCLVTLLAGCVLAAAPPPAAPKGSSPSTPRGTTAPPKSSATAARTATFSFVCATPAVLLPAPVKQIVT